MVRHGEVHPNPSPQCVIAGVSSTNPNATEASLIALKSRYDFEGRRK